MADGSRIRPVELVQNLLVAVERLAASMASPDREPGDRIRMAAEAAVQGASDELSARFPDSNEALEALVRDGLQVLARLAHEAATQPAGAPGDWARTMAAGAFRGTLEEASELMPRIRMLSEQIAERLTLALEQTGKAADERAKWMRQPGDRARRAASGATRGAIVEFHQQLPNLIADLKTLGPVGEELGRVLGQSLVASMAAQLRVELARTDQPLTTRMEQLAERSTAAALRGAGDELSRRLKLWRANRRPGDVRATVNEAVGGAWDALAARLRVPMFAAAAGVTVLFAARFAFPRRA